LADENLTFQMYELATMNEQFIKPAPYLEAIERRLALVDHYSVASFLLVRSPRRGDVERRTFLR
jgi:hypothetical protein